MGLLLSSSHLEGENNNLQSAFYNRAIYTRKNKTRFKQDANFPYKRHISSKIRRGLAKTRLILEQPLTPVLR